MGQPCLKLHSGRPETSCYTRHLSDLFAMAGIEHTRQNARRADGCIRRILGKEEEDCPKVWKEVKAWLADARKKETLAARLGETFGTKQPHRLVWQRRLVASEASPEANARSG